MITTFPERIKFITDGNEAILLRTEKTKSKADVGWYQYVVSETKLGYTQPMELEQIQKLVGFGVVEIMKG